MSGKVFPQDKWRRLISPDREKVLNRSKFFEISKPTENEIWADVGCGPGYFTLPLAEKVKKVFAVDISRSMLDVCETRAKENRIANIEFIKSDSENFNIPAASVDKALLVTVFHEFNDKNNAVEKIKNILKDNGEVYIIDWKKIETEFGPPVKHRLLKESVINMFTDSGFELAGDWPLYDYYYTLVFKM